MPRFARIFIITLVSAAGSCSGEQLAQKQVETKDIRQQLATAYESCVRTSFASQLPTMVDRNMAIDQALSVCQTEEKKLQDVSDGAISAYRNTLNEHLETRKGSSFSSTPARCGLRYRLKAAVSAVLCATGRPQKPGRGVVSPTQ
jgi:hypothetical protein